MQKHYKNKYRPLRHQYYYQSKERIYKIHVTSSTSKLNKELRMGCCIVTSEDKNSIKIALFAQVLSKMYATPLG